MIGAGMVALAFFSLVAFAEWVTYNLWADGTAAGPASGVIGAVATIAMAFVPSSIAVLVFALAGGYRWTLGRRSAALVILSLAASAGRLGEMRIVWGAGLSGLRAVAELLNGIVPPLLALVIGLYYVDAQDRTRRIQRLIAVREVEAQKALADLEHEELRVRRSVSDTLHGRIQQRLVFIAASLTPIAQAARQAGREDEANELAGLIDDLDRLREEEVRQVSHALYPSGLDMGLQQALRLEIARIPASIAVEYRLSPAAAGVDDVTNPEFDSADRLLLVSAVEEGVTNALKHGTATALTIGVDVEQIADRPMVVVTVSDDGQAAPKQSEPDPSPANESEVQDLGLAASGLARLERRFEARGGGLEFTPGDGHGATLRVWLPRPTEPMNG
jgi:signal transduction histidine kinase